MLQCCGLGGGHGLFFDQVVFLWLGWTNGRKTPDMRFIFAVNLLPITPAALPSYADDTQLFRVQASQTSNCAGCQFSIGRGMFFILLDFLLGKSPRHCHVFLLLFIFLATPRQSVRKPRSCHRSRHSLPPLD